MPEATYKGKNQKENILMAEKPGLVRKTRMWQAKVVRIKDDRYNTDNILDETTEEDEE